MILKRLHTYSPVSNLHIHTQHEHTHTAKGQDGIEEYDSSVHPYSGYRFAGDSRESNYQFQTIAVVNQLLIYTSLQAQTVGGGIDTTTKNKGVCNVQGDYTVHLGRYRWYKREILWAIDRWKKDVWELNYTDMHVLLVL